MLKCVTPVFIMYYERATSVRTESVVLYILLGFATIEYLRLWNTMMIFIEYCNRM